MSKSRVVNNRLKNLQDIFADIFVVESIDSERKKYGYILGNGKTQIFHFQTYSSEKANNIQLQQELLRELVEYLRKNTSIKQITIRSPGVNWSRIVPDDIPSNIQLLFKNSSSEARCFAKEFALWGNYRLQLDYPLPDKIQLYTDGSGSSKANSKSCGWVLTGSEGEKTNNVYKIGGCPAHAGKTSSEVELEALLRGLSSTYGGCDSSLKRVDIKCDNGFPISRYKNEEEITNKTLRDMAKKQKSNYDNLSVSLEQISRKYNIADIPANFSNNLEFQI